jgi:hypothetical protein
VINAAAAMLAIRGRFSIFYARGRNHRPGSFRGDRSMLRREVHPIARIGAIIDVVSESGMGSSRRPSCARASIGGFNCLAFAWHLHRSRERSSVRIIFLNRPAGPDDASSSILLDCPIFGPLGAERIRQASTEPTTPRVI